MARGRLVGKRDLTLAAVQSSFRLPRDKLDLLLVSGDRQNKGWGKIQ